MPADPLKIVQISTRDVGGGAERVAHDLFTSLRARGHASEMLVGYRYGNDPDVHPIRHDRVGSLWSRFWWKKYQTLQPYYAGSRLARRLCRIVHGLAAPAGVADRRRGLEDFHFPGIYGFLERRADSFDVIHAHNLHGHYFDLGALPRLCAAAPLVVTLHDAWLLSGHCAHSLACDRWRTGCGHCPDLTLYPAVRRDATEENLRRKRRIYAASQLHLAAPCQWLMDRVSQSVLAPFVASSRVIPYGVNLDVFRPGCRDEERRAIGIGNDRCVVSFAAKGIRTNPWKDFDSLQTALAIVASRNPTTRVVVLAVGDDAAPRRLGNVEIRFIPFLRDPPDLARIYRASDLYVHAAKVDTFPNSILEALACGTPVVATGAGGIPEQIRSLPDLQTGGSSLAATGTRENATGIVVDPGDADRLAHAIALTLGDQTLRRQLGHNAARDARDRFDLNRQIDDYFDWYRELIAKRRVNDRRTADPSGIEALNAVAAV